MAGKTLLYVWAAAVVCWRVEATHKIMTDITLGFGQALDRCREESGLTEEMMEQFFHVWDKDFKFENRELGCALRCMSHYFNLHNGDSHKLHLQNTEEFFKSFPNGEELAGLLVGLIHECEKKFDGMEDKCMRSLRIGECLRDACFERKLAPSMEMLLAEFIMQTEA